MSLLNYFTLANPETSYYAVAGSGMPIPGPTGPAGPAGATGAIGPAGNSILSGPLPPTAGLGQVNDLYVDFTTSQLYDKTDPVTWTPEFSMIGPAGAAATVAVGVTTTLPPGSAANVNNSGTAQNAIFNFAIPQGATGPTGPQGVPGSAATASVWSTFPATQAVDMASNLLINATGIAAPVGIAITAATGDITLNLNDPSGNPKVLVQGGALDLDGEDLNNLGSLTTSGAANTVEFGAIIPPAAPLASFSVLSSEVSLSHLDPLTQMLIRGQGDVRVESTNGDLNLIGDDVNISTTGATNVLNITSLGVMQNTAGGAINNSAGGAFAVQAGGLISMLTTGSIQIGSGNVLGATTSIEKLDINDSVVTKLAGASDLQFQNTTLVQNSGNPLNTLTLEATDATTTLRGEGVVIETTGTPVGGSGSVQVKTPAWVTAVIDISAGNGVTSFNNVAPQCAIVPAAAADLTNKSYVDSAVAAGVATRLPNNADISFNFNFAVPIADASGNSPFIYVPAAVGVPTGTPAAIAGCVPLYMDTTGGLAKLYAYVSGAWVAI